MSAPSNEILRPNAEVPKRTISESQRLLKMAPVNPGQVRTFVDQEQVALKDQTKETVRSRENVLARMRRSDEPDFSMAA